MLLGIVALTAVVLFGLGPILVRAAYRGESLPWLNAVIRGQAANPVEHYLGLWHALGVRLLTAELLLVLVVIGLLSAPFQGLVDRFLGPVAARFARPPGYGMGAASAIGASLVIVALAGGQLADIVLSREDWPFSSYPMYSGQERDSIEWTRVYGVTATGEIVLVPERHLRPFDTARLHYAINGAVLHRPEQPAARDRALRTFHELYEAGRRAGEHDGPPVQALRLYIERWQLDPSLTNRDAPDQRSLLHEFRVRP